MTEDIVTVVEVLIVGPAIFCIGIGVWAIWGVVQAAQSARRWWSDLGVWLTATS